MRHRDVVEVLQLIFICGRSCAYKERDAKFFCGFFDDAEYIAGLFARKEFNDPMILGVVKDFAARYDAGLALGEYQRRLAKA
jgi:hypothetical protein